MFEKLLSVEERYEDISTRLSDPAVISDNEKYRSLMKEYKNLTPIVEKYREYRKACASHEEAAELLEEGGLDRDFREIVEEQYRESQEKMDRTGEELKILLLPKDPNDDKNVIMEIRGGAGGEEAALFAHSLMRMYTMYAERNRWKVEVLNLNDTELGGVKEASFSITGETGKFRHDIMKFRDLSVETVRVPEFHRNISHHKLRLFVAAVIDPVHLDAADVQYLRQI